MKQPLQIQFHGMEPCENVELTARARAVELDQSFPQIVSCRVDIDVQGGNCVRSGLVGVRIDVSVPGHELTVNRLHDKDIQAALHNAFDGIQRRLKDMDGEAAGRTKREGIPMPSAPPGQSVRNPA